MAKRFFKVFLRQTSDTHGHPHHRQAANRVAPMEGLDIVISPAQLPG